MKLSEIPNFVDEVIATGCAICAVGHDMYVLGDVQEIEAAGSELRRIGEKYGPRDHLQTDVIAYLRSIGRFVDVTWMEPPHQTGWTSQPHSFSTICFEDLGTQRQRRQPSGALFEGAS
ncbi:hypothetical protein [Ensifer adhaerens]|uniref:hypothetical protein n=1 Tax=Ensifer adhaerens TaxID=106592 RepID=UPI002E2A40AF|nr:hypothetical protein [Ensifer adhaerens]